MASTQTTLQPFHSRSPQVGPNASLNFSRAYAASDEEGECSPRSWLPGTMMDGIGGTRCEDPRWPWRDSVENSEVDARGSGKLRWKRCT